MYSALEHSVNMAIYKCCIYIMYLLCTSYIKKTLSRDNGMECDKECTLKGQHTLKPNFIEYPAIHTN